MLSPPINAVLMPPPFDSRHAVDAAITSFVHFADALPCCRCLLFRFFSPRDIDKIYNAVNSSTTPVSPLPAFADIRCLRRFSPAFSLYAAAIFSALMMPPLLYGYAADTGHICHAADFRRFYGTRRQMLAA